MKIWLAILLVCFASWVRGADSDLGGPGAETAFSRSLKTNWTTVQWKNRLQVWTNLFDPLYFTVSNGTNVSFIPGSLTPQPTNVFDSTYFLVSNGTNISAKPNPIVAASTDSRLSDARTPLAHANTHTNGGSDFIRLDTLAAPTDNTSNNATASAHGLLKKLSGSASDFMNGAGNWAVPPDVGEANTASNVGTIGTGIFKQKSLLDLQFYKVNSIDSKLTIALNGTDRIDFTVNSDAVVAASTDSRLSDARTPTVHNVLDSTKHGDVLTGSVARGDLLVGNSTPKIAKFAIGTGFLHGNGTDVDSWRALASGDLNGLSLTNVAFYGRATNNGSAWTVAEGGSGAATLTGILQGNGTSAFTALTGTSNYIPKWGGFAPYLTSTSRIFDNGSNVGIGTAIPGVGNTLHIVGSGGENASFRMTAYGADASVDSRMLWQRANGTEAAPSMVSSGDKLRLLFQTYDGVSFKGLAEIRATVDGTPNTNDMPGRLIFATSVAGSGSGAFERLRIDNFGTVGINTTTATNRLEVLDTAGPQLRLTYANASTFSTFQTDVSGFLSINPSGKRTSFGGTTTPQNTVSVTSPADQNFSSGNSHAFKIDSGTGLSTDDALIFSVHTGDFSWLQAIQPGTAFRNIILQPGGGNTGVGITNPASILQVGGAIATPIVTKTTNYTLTITDDFILGDASNSNLTFTLPAVVSGREYTVKRINAGTNVVTVATTSSQTIDGATTFTLTARYQGITVKADSASWWIK